MTAGPPRPGGRIAVVGGGIGGLAAAAFLRRAGLAAMKSGAGPWNQVAVIQPSVGCQTVANRSQSPASRHSAQFSTSSRMANLSASAVGGTKPPLAVGAVTYGHTACHRRRGIGQLHQA